MVAKWWCIYMYCTGLYNINTIRLVRLQIQWSYNNINPYLLTLRLAWTPILLNIFYILFLFIIIHSSFRLSSSPIMYFFRYKCHSIIFLSNSVLFVKFTLCKIELHHFQVNVIKKYSKHLNIFILVSKNLFNSRKFIKWLHNSQKLSTQDDVDTVQLNQIPC